MLNRNAARHLLLVVSILLCAFIYAGYYLATRGDDASSDPDPAAASAANAGAAGTGAGSLRPSSAPGAMTEDIPSADGDTLSLVPPATAPSTRPLSPPPAAASSDPNAISGLIPEMMTEPEDAASGSSGMMPGANLPIPGFAASPSDAAQSVPVLALPGMAAADDGEGDFGDEDFASFATGDDEGDFAALPGMEGDAEPTPPPAASVLPPPPATTTAAVATLAPPPASAPAAGTGTALRPPPPAGAPVTANTPAAAPARTSIAPPPPPAPLASNDPAGDGGMAETDSLRIYVVAPGDTLSSIAMRELGSGFLADNIFLLNRDVIEDPNHLMVGVKIRLPYANPATSGGTAGSADAAAAAVSGDARGDVPGRRPTQGLGGSHIVARGDTLSSIALQYYGTSAAWRFLYEANKTTVPNPNQLTVGMQLAIPPYEE